jgi:hypothetical protein
MRLAGDRLADLEAVGSRRSPTIGYSAPESKYTGNRAETPSLSLLLDQRRLRVVHRVLYPSRPTTMIVIALGQRLCCSMANSK